MSDQGKSDKEYLEPFGTECLDKETSECAAEMERTPRLFFTESLHSKKETVAGMIRGRTCNLQMSVEGNQHAYFNFF